MRGTIESGPRRMTAKTWKALSMPGSSTPEPDCSALIAAATNLLDATRSMVEALPDGVYAEPAPSCDDATIGQHVRHLVCHFESLLAGYDEDAVIAYDVRARGGDVETDPAAAATAVAAVTERLSHMDDVQMHFPVTIQIMTAADADHVSLPSTVLRELAFVTHHGIHHHAMIKLLARAHGIELSGEFGRAPSTLRADAEG